MFLNVIETPQLLFRAVVYFVQLCSISMCGVRTYALRLPGSLVSSRNREKPQSGYEPEPRKELVSYELGTGFAVANATTYDAQVAWLTCFNEKQEKATIQLRTRAKKGTG